MRLRGLLPCVAVAALAGCLSSPPEAVELRLAGLELSAGALEPEFDPEVTEYEAAVGLSAAELSVLPVVAAPDDLTIHVEDEVVESGQLSAPIALPLGPREVTVRVANAEDEELIYRVVVDRGAGIAQEAYLKASNTGEGDGFGGDVAVDGDTIAVGASYEDGSGTGVDPPDDDDTVDSGAVYVFVRDGDTWVQQAMIKSPNTDVADGFGQTVALDGDTLVVGAPFDDSLVGNVDDCGTTETNCAPDSGAVHVFVREGSTWEPDAFLKIPSPRDTDTFGLAIDVEGDMLVASAPNHDGAVTDCAEMATDECSAGSVFVFRRGGSGWVPDDPPLRMESPEFFGLFGFSLALSDGILVVGATLEDYAPGKGTKVGDAGAAYVYQDLDGFVLRAKLLPRTPEVGDNCGVAVAIAGSTAAMACRNDDAEMADPDDDCDGAGDNCAADSGAIYLFQDTGETWNEVAFLKAPNADSDDVFGFDLAMPTEDILVAGATGEDSQATGVNGDMTSNTGGRSGAAYLFTQVDGEWTLRAYLKASNTGRDDRMGGAVATDGATVVLGAFEEDSNATGVNGDQNNNDATDAGAVYVFE